MTTPNADAAETEATPPPTGEACARPRLSLVICTLNEAQSIGPLLDEAGAALAASPYEIIVVDDDSTDGTAERVAERQAADPRIRLVSRRGVRGLASAAVEGWRLAEGELLALMDGDGQHDPALVAQLATALEAEGAELAVASRYLGEGGSGLSRRREAISRAATAAAGLVLKAPLSDPMSGCFVMRRDWYETARPRLSALGFKILFDLAASSPGPVKFIERPAALRARTGGVSKLDARVMIELAALVVEKAAGGRIPAQFLLFAAVGASGVAVNLGLLAVGVKLAGEQHFIWLQAVAVLGAMTWNFVLNSVLTFRAAPLRGWGLVRGFLGFCLACSAGALMNELTATGLHRIGAHWALAGGAGALSGGVWNFWAVRYTTWRKARFTARR
jgi:dolichol-phosphate mannosyltransferase